MKIWKKGLSLLLAFAMLIGFVPAFELPVFAGHTCIDCQEWIDGSPYCSECFACDECVELCYQCGKCTGCSGADICDGCTSEEGSNMCTDCSEEKGAHCPNCGTCYYIAESWCAECGFCEDCNDICDDCSVNLGFGLLCWTCAEDKESHCPGCGGCYFASGLWCEECMLCAECSEHDQGCSTDAGAILCKECATERGNHCPECAECYYDVGSWCEECGKCENCSPACLYCCEEAGEVICEECAIEQGMHCTQCSECYDGGEFCAECGVCTACAEICATDELCIECAIANGVHCPSCEECCDQAILCEGCGEKCSECADAFCESCNLCSECVRICQGCGSCEECAEICPNCEEYCSECEGICDDCEFCLVCCQDIAGLAGCDCAGWVCVESVDWEDHFKEAHTVADGSHDARPTAVWEWDDTYHWHGCAYCEAQGHVTGKAKHSFDATGKCTACYYVKDAKIQILVQPKDVKYVSVTSAEESYDESNIARFSVKAMGNGKLTYTWCRRTYVGGQPTYEPLKYPASGECYDGQNLAILAPTDACCNEYYICCFITDEQGNEVKTRDALLTGRHDYQYYKEWRTHQRPYEEAERNKYGHVLKCVGEDCEKITRLLPHEDEDRNGLCDICDYEIGKILITKQPKDVKNVYVSSAIEDDSDINYAHFHVEAVGESKLTYTWCRKQYVNKVLTYVPLSGSDPNECFDGPDATIQAPTDSCCSEYTYACIITDEEGNETRTVDVVLAARHNYQYYKQYLTHENPYPDAKRRYNSHVLVCVGEGCGKVTRYRKHEDLNHDYVCDICDSKKDIMRPGIFVTPPEEGQLPNYTVDSDSPAYFALGSVSYPGTRRVWMVSDDGENGWTPVDPTFPFAEGKYYKFYVEIHTAEGYSFPPMASYGEDPFIWALVNENGTKAHAVSGVDPLHHISLEYNFGLCGDSGAEELRIIDSIVVENIPAPVAGEYPCYESTFSGVGYTRNTAYDNGTYAINGMCWYDLTYDMWMRPNRAFQVGHQYKVFVDVKTEEGYWFNTSGTSYKPIGSGYVNGYSAVLGIQSDARFEQSLSVVFTCQPKTVRSVSVSGLEEPADGRSPDFTAVTASEFYTVESIEWYDYENDLNEMTSTDTFVEGNEYWIRITVVPNQDEGTNMCKFVEDKTTAYLNGIEVKKVKNNSWQEVESTAKRVRIYYTFKSSRTVSGQVESFGDDFEDITLQLIPQGLPEPAYETVVKGNNVAYSFTSVAPGTYTLKAFKLGHAVSEYTVVVSDSNVIQNVKLSLRGDMDSDGDKDLDDAIYLLYHVNFSADYPITQSGDLNQSGEVDLDDAIYLLYHVNFSESYPLS